MASSALHQVAGLQAIRRNPLRESARRAAVRPCAAQRAKVVLTSAAKDEQVEQAASWISAWRARTGGETGKSAAQTKPAAAPAKPGAAFTILVEALAAANLSSVLSDPGPYTVFAPSDAAFAAALQALGATKEQLLARPDLGDILKYHVVPGRLTAASLQDGSKATTVQGAPLLISVGAGGVSLNQGTAKVVSADVESSNGVIHVIDAVLLPPAPAPAVAAVAAPPAVASDGGLYDDGKEEPAGKGISQDMKARLRNEYIGFGGSANESMGSNNFFNLIVAVGALVIIAYYSGALQL